MPRSRYVAVLVAAGALAGAVAAPASAAAETNTTDRIEREHRFSDRLEFGQQLTVGHSLRSPNGATQLRVDHGGLELYYNGQRVWTTSGVKFGKVVHFTDSMDLMVEGRNRAESELIDTSERAKRAGASVRLQVTDNGKVQIVSTNAERTVLWENGQLSQRRNLIPGETLPVGERLISSDGRTVLEHRGLPERSSRLVITVSGKTVWQSPVVRYSGSAKLTPEGDFVLKSILLSPGEGEVLVWSSETSGYVKPLQTQKFELVATVRGEVALEVKEPHFFVAWRNGHKTY